eukprot:1361858-Rhodomonas_salina.1
MVVDGFKQAALVQKRPTRVSLFPDPCPRRGTLFGPQSTATHTMSKPVSFSTMVPKLSADETCIFEERNWTAPAPLTHFAHLSPSTSRFRCTHTRCKSGCEETKTGFLLF